MRPAHLRCCSSTVFGIVGEQLDMIILMFGEFSLLMCDILSPIVNVFFFFFVELYLLFLYRIERQIYSHAFCALVSALISDDVTHRVCAVDSALVVLKRGFGGYIFFWDGFCCFMWIK